tara:strand:- start:406 stop:645 length:240 start_codon:yes stop_codon:yes gene_type:complete
MEEFSDFLTSPLAILFLSFVILLSFMWLFLPFAVYGLRNKLDRIILLLEEISQNKNSKNLHENDESSAICKENQPNHFE